MVQWLRLLAPNGGSMGSIPGWGTKIPHVVCPINKIKQLKKKKKHRYAANGSANYTLFSDAV